MTTMSVNIIKTLSTRDFVIKCVQTPCVFMVRFEDPPFASASEAVKSLGVQMTVTFQAYDYEAKHFKVCKTE